MYDTIYDAKVSPVTQTEIRKVSYKNGELDGTGDVVIDGMVNDSFSIDEYNGYLRVVTTIRENDDTSGGVNPLLRTDSASNTGSQGADSTNALYILDKDLKETGKLDNLAEDERVYSARFMGDTCYFVTYKQVDPLFSVDLSDPKKPKVLGELKIPGFSDYLHPYGDGLLLGIGMVWRRWDNSEWRKTVYVRYFGSERRKRSCEKQCWRSAIQQMYPIIIGQRL